MANTIKLGNGNWATKEGSLLAYNDENNNFKPLPFTTTRASSATVVNKQGLIETVGSGIPRIDFKDDANGALLLEPQRTNSFLQSNQFDTTWGKSAQITLTSGQPDPFGGTDAFLVNLGASVGNAISQNVSLLSGVEYTMSAYIKGVDLTSLRMIVAGNSSALVTSQIVNGTWVRVVITRVAASTGFLTNQIVRSNNALSESFYIYGAQLEQGSYATSYIPTQGTTQTRVADTASDAGNSTVINSTEGVLYAEIASFNETPINMMLSLSDGTFNNNVFIRYNSALNTIQVAVRIASNYIYSKSTNSYTITDFNKIAIKWKANDFSFYFNGTQINSQLSGSSFSNSILSNVSFDDGGGIADFYGKTKDLRVYTTALSNAELQALTQ